MSKHRILHCFGDSECFVAEDLPNRVAKLGKNVEHHLVGVSAEQWNRESAGRSVVTPQFVTDFPSLTGKPMPGRLIALANAMKPFDLVLSYGWSAIDTAMAHTLFKDALGLPPLVHHETLLGEERQRLSKRRSWYRRVALGKAAGLVVPTERLEEIALVNWQQPLGRVKRFAPGVEMPKRVATPETDALRGVIKRAGELWIGALLRNRSDMDSGLNLIEALCQVSEEWHLVVLADGPEIDRLKAKAEECEVAHRMHVTSPPDDLTAVIGLFDLWSALGDGAAIQTATLQALAHARPVLAIEESETAALLHPASQALLADSAEYKSLAQPLAKLTNDAELRAQLSEENRIHAANTYDQAQALDRYRRLYASALKAEIRQ